MDTNPNQAYKDRELKGGDGVMMTEYQRVIIERQCKKHNISLMRLTTRALGYRKKTADITHIDAARCIMMGAVWGNYVTAGYEPERRLNVKNSHE